MKKLFENIRSDKILAFGFWSSLGAIILGLIYITLSYSKLPPLIPLFNQLPWGEPRIGEKLQIFLPILVAFSVFLGNLIFAFIFYKKMPLISRVLSVTSFLVCFFTLLFIIRTIQIII